jgi:hypothetical protein
MLRRGLNKWDDHDLRTGVVLSGQVLRFGMDWIPKTINRPDLIKQDSPDDRDGLDGKFSRIDFHASPSCPSPKFLVLGIRGTSWANIIAVEGEAEPIVIGIDLLEMPTT